MNNNIISMITRVKKNIESTLTELHQFEKEYNPNNAQDNKNLLMMINDLERNFYTLQILTDRLNANIFLNVAIEESESKGITKFLKDRVKENTNLFMYLSIYFDLE